jgi:hypothetical protein
MIYWNTKRKTQIRKLSHLTFKSIMQLSIYNLILNHDGFQLPVTKFSGILRL